MAPGHIPRFLRFIAIASLAAWPAFHGVAGSDPDIYCIRADEVRGRIWILAADGVYLYHQATRETRRYQLPGWIHASRSVGGKPDLVVKPTGEAIASSNIVPHLWQVDPDGGAAVEARIDIGHESAKDMGFTALQAVNPGVIVAKSSIDGSAWRIDLRARRAWKAGPGEVAR
jgi:hypothetical protein